ncbi:hypothetical protein CCICO_09100 [Corynebacterium ciconiae DSM 44920]|uniref:hypothetical protein n=1 Tax=Corynebacterium ciconiae TaxID=227319 RepID=UPI0003817C1B|nr:hypothetical protein [Corynebacterium ciconiae]WKD61828.1 hypothetical protein CCICO_09100 [Corynebacterium ciconiae DSM 44920]
MTIVDNRERCLFDATTPVTGLTFPALELVAWTGLAWIAIGFFDRLPGSPGYEHVGYFPAETRGLVLLLWVVLVLWRFVLPVVRARRRQFKVTTQRVVVRGPFLRGRAQSIGMSYIYRASKQRGAVVLEVAGQPQPMVFHGVPKAKQAVQAINSVVAQRR